MVLLGKAVYFLWVMLLTNLLPMRMAPLATGAAYMVLLLGFAAINLFPLWKKGGFTRLGVMLGGEYLLVLGVLSFMLNLVLSIAYGFCLLGKGWGTIPFVIHILFWILFSTILVLNGFFRIFFTSVQWGIRRRVVFLLFWWVPVAGLVLLVDTCRLVRQEYEIETEKQKLNALRRVEGTCRTHYPLVLVHGVFFRDRKYFNYWGRIPGELIRNGATVYYGGQQSAASTENAAKELRERILRIIEETGCGKVNIIAHSKGALGCRQAGTGTLCGLPDHDQHAAPRLRLCRLAAGPSSAGAVPLGRCPVQRGVAAAGRPPSRFPRCRLRSDGGALCSLQR